MQNNDTYRMYENDVDQLFGSRLENYRPPDQGNDWDDLQKRLDARDGQRKKPAYGKWLLALLLLGGIGAGTIYLLSPSNNKTPGNTYAQQEQAAPTPAGNTGDASKEKAVTNNSNSDPSAVTATPSSMQNNTTATGNNPNNNITAAAQNNNNNTTANNSSKNIRRNNTVVVNNNRNTTAADRTIPFNIKPQPSANPGNRTGRNIAAKNKVRNGAKGTLPERSGKNGGVTFGQEEAVLNTEESSAAGAIAKQETETASTTLESKETNIPVTENEPKKEAVTQSEPAEKNTGSIMNTHAADQAAMAKVTPPAKSKKKTRVRKEAPEHDYSNMQGKWYLEAFSGYNNSIKDSKSFAAFLAPAGYVEKRLNQENALVSLQAGVNVKYRRNHFIFGTGLSYLELGDMVKYDAGYSGAVALGANGRSRLTYLEVPVSAGYDWANKRWGFSLQGGISAGVLMGAKGQYVSVDSFNSKLFSLNGNKDIFRKTQLNLLITPSVNYYLNENTNVFVSPLYRLNLQPVTVTGASLNQKYYGMGLRVGIRTSLK